MSVTTIQAAGRLARHLRTGDFTRLTVNELADLLEAMNAGLQELYDVLPTRFRRTPVSCLLQGPTTVSAQVTNGSSAVGNTPFSADDIGKTVQISGDANWNEVTATNGLLDAYLGVTGTRDALIYHDTALDPSFPFERMITRPVLAKERFELTHYNAREAGLEPAIGMPRYYWIEDLSAALGREARFVMRLHPAPDQAYNLRVVLAFWPVRLALSALQTPTQIYVPDEFYETGFLPLAAEHLTRSIAWANPGTKAQIVRDAEKARAKLRGQPGYASAAQNFVGTPRGF